MGIIAVAGIAVIIVGGALLVGRSRRAQRPLAEEPPTEAAAAPAAAAPGPSPAATELPTPGTTASGEATPRAGGPAQAPPRPAAVPLDEASLMKKLRALEGTNPPLTLRLAREGNRRLPDSPDAPERAWMAVKALANMENFREARDEARVMVKRYPGTSWSLDVQRHLLSNPLDD